MKNVIVVLAGTWVLFSCASSQKRKCESTHWSNHGLEIAKRGGQPSSDEWVLQCEREKASIDRSALDRGFKEGVRKYCTPDFSFEIGSRGDFLNTSFCDVSDIKTMKIHHERGVAEFCKKSNGQALGESGKTYNGICPKTLESEFLTQFRIGRKKFLLGVVKQREIEILEVGNEIGKLEQEHNRINYDFNQNEGFRKPRVPNNVDDPLRAKRQEELTAFENQQRELKAKMKQIEGLISAKKVQQQSLKKEIKETQIELRRSGLSTE